MSTAYELDHPPIDTESAWAKFQKQNALSSSDIESVCNMVAALPPVGTWQAKFEYLNL